MKISARPRLLTLVVAIASVLTLTAFRSAPATDEQKVLASIQLLFDGMAKRDLAVLKAQTLPSGTLVVMHDGKSTQMTLESWAERIGKPSPTRIEESIQSPLVRIDNDLAVVWAPFQVRIDGKLTSCGTDLFNLIRVDDKWIIASVAYTGRSDCPAN